MFALYNSAASLQAASSQTVGLGPTVVVVGPAVDVFGCAVVELGSIVVESPF